MASINGNRSVNTYNADGERVQKTEVTANGDKVSKYLIDPTFAYPQTVQTVTTDNGTDTTTDYVWGRKLIERTRGGQGTFYDSDALGSIKALTDANGNVTDRYEYGAFGTLLNHTGSSDNAYRYTGEYFDDTAALQYNRARWYDASVGRFVSLDKWNGFSYRPISLNKYAYAESNPINSGDPSGNETLESVGATEEVSATLASAAIGEVRLGFTFVTNSLGHVVGVAATTCVLSYGASQFGLTTSMSQFSKMCEDDSNRGRWQAQGGGLQKDQPWSLPAPLTLSHGLQLLDDLEASLTSAERRARATGFEQARIFARRASRAGGLTVTTGVFKRSFPNGATKRVDLDIFKGTAFIAD